MPPNGATTTTKSALPALVHKGRVSLRVAIYLTRQQARAVVPSRVGANASPMAQALPESPFDVRASPRGGGFARVARCAVRLWRQGLTNHAKHLVVTGASHKFGRHPNTSMCHINKAVQGP